MSTPLAWIVSVCGAALLLDGWIRLEFSNAFSTTTSLSPTLTVPWPPSVPVLISNKTSTVAMPPFIVSPPPLFRSRLSVLKATVPGVLWSSTRIVLPEPLSVVWPRTIELIAVGEEVGSAHQGIAAVRYGKVRNRVARTILRNERYSRTCRHEHGCRSARRK